MMQVQATCVCGKAYWPNQSWQHTGCGGDAVSNKAITTVSNPEYLRVKLWREANRDRYNASQKETMRRRRMKAA